MTQLDDLVAACAACAKDSKAAKSTRALASALGAWAPTVSGLPQPPEPPPTPPPAPPAWVGDFSTGDYSQYTGGLSYDGIRATPPGPTAGQFDVVTGAQYPHGHAGRFIVKQAYSPFGWNESCEVIQPWTDTGEGAHFFYGWHVTMPAGFVAPQSWWTILQWYTETFTHFAGPAPLAVDGGSDKLILNLNTGLYSGGGYATNAAVTFEPGPVWDGRTRRYIFEVLWSKANGAVTVYRLDDGTWTVTGSFSGPTLRFDPTFNGGAADPIGESKLGGYRGSLCKDANGEPAYSESGNIFGPNGQHVAGTCFYGAAGVQPDSVIFHGFARDASFEPVAAWLTS